MRPVRLGFDDESNFFFLLVLRGFPALPCPGAACSTVQSRQSLISISARLIHCTSSSSSNHHRQRETEQPRSASRCGSARRSRTFTTGVCVCAVWACRVCVCVCVCVSTCVCVCASPPAAAAVVRCACACGSRESLVWHYRLLLLDWPRLASSTTLIHYRPGAQAQSACLAPVALPPHTTSTTTTTTSFPPPQPPPGAWTSSPPPPLSLLRCAFYDLTPLSRLYDGPRSTASSLRKTCSLSTLRLPPSSIFSRLKYPTATPRGLSFAIDRLRSEHSPPPPPPVHVTLQGQRPTGYALLRKFAATRSPCIRHFTHR